ncbi:MAG: hypothetical protein K1X66_09660 [Verrucomicrobiae bacterium]|nr:hypothetical protein [Verrucomicrobiae bacterium]
MQKQQTSRNPFDKITEVSSFLDRLDSPSVADYAASCAAQGKPMDPMVLIDIAKTINGPNNSIKTGGMGMF